MGGNNCQANPHGYHENDQLIRIKTSSPSSLEWYNKGLWPWPSSLERYGGGLTWPSSSLEWYNRGLTWQVEAEDVPVDAGPTCLEAAHMLFSIIIIINVILIAIIIITVIIITNAIITVVIVITIKDVSPTWADLNSCVPRMRLILPLKMVLCNDAGQWSQYCLSG